MQTSGALLSLFVLVACGPVDPKPDAGRTDSGKGDSGASSELDAGDGEADAGQGLVDAGQGLVDGGWPYSNSTTPDVLGPYATSVVTTSVRRGGRTTPVVALVPTGLGPAPMIVFLPGATLTTSMYLPLLERLASHGFVVVRADPSFSLFSADHAAMAADVKAVIDWALAPTEPLASRIDATKVAMMGHSLGGKLSVMVAFNDPRVKAVFGIDPVNQQSPNVVPGQVSPLVMPLGFVGEAVDASGGLFGMSCAPAAGNYTTFYNAATASTYAAEWTFADINHMDFVDTCTGSGCSLCNSANGDAAVARARLRILSVAFFRLHFRAETTMATWLTGGSMPSGLTLRHR